MKVTIEVSQASLDALLSSAGYSKYWADFLVDKHGVLVVHDRDGSGRYFAMTEDRVRRGLRQMAKVAAVSFADVLVDDGYRVDGPVADVFVQCCCFGELKYG